MPTIMPVTEVRRVLTSLIARLERPVYITQHGRARAVLIDAEQFDELLDELEDLRLAADPAWRARVAHIRELARDEAQLHAAEARGELIPLAQLETELGLIEAASQDAERDEDVSG